MTPTRRNNYDNEGFTADMSDCFNSTGAYPAVVGYDFTTTVYDGIDLTDHVKEAYSHGSVITFDFRANNPATKGPYDNISGTPCQEILTEGTDGHSNWCVRAPPSQPHDLTTSRPHDLTAHAAHALTNLPPRPPASRYEDLDKVADKLSNYTYTTDEGITERIPIIFRFFHEAQGGWYWWGSGNNSATSAAHANEPTCKTEHYQRVWLNTQNYFTEKGFDNILWLYAPASPISYGREKVLERLPTEATVDLIGMDQYTKQGEYVQVGPVTTHHAPRTTHYAPPTTHHSSPTTHHPPPTTFTHLLFNGTHPLAHSPPHTLPPLLLIVDEGQL